LLELQPIQLEEVQPMPELNALRCLVLTLKGVILKHLKTQHLSHLDIGFSSKVDLLNVEFIE
jgi:hypothetical protein